MPMSSKQNMTPAEVVSYWESREGEHEYLKEVLGDKALGWVKGRNTHCLESLGDPAKSPLYSKVLSILDSEEKIPYLRKINDLYYNFWQDSANPRGIWRRTTMDAYLSPATTWETVLDFDALGKEEGESWVYKGHSVYEPPVRRGERSQRVERTMMQLSRGGADAVVMREFDLEKKEFVQKDAFLVPEGKSRVAWMDIDTLLIGTDLKDGQSMTESGYPRVMREWKRGTPLSSSKVVFEGEKSDVSVYMYVSKHRHHRYVLKGRAITFYTSTNSIFVPYEVEEPAPFSAPGSASTPTGTGPSPVSASTPARPRANSQMFASPSPIAGGEQGNEGGQWFQLKVPLDAEVSLFADQLLIQLRSPWTLQPDTTPTPTATTPYTTYPQGTLLSVDLKDFLENSWAATFVPMFLPTPTVSLESYAAMRDFLVLETLDVVKSRFQFWQYDEEDGSWLFAGAEQGASIRGASLSAIDAHESNQYWLTSSSFLQPTTLQLGDATQGPAGVAKVKSLKSLPAQFNSEGLIERQFQATSEDGTKVPYFLVSHKDMPMDGTTPTLLYGYGGFEISLPPVYSGVVGAGWLDTTGEPPSDTGTASASTPYRAYVMANIRGGGEFGPAWHQAALRENRKLAYDDFIAVAEDLIARGVTSSAKLGIRGGSNGGLLMGNMITRRPDLFGAVCCAVPLLDMKCYHTLLAGASWVAEYGNPDSQDWDFLKSYSAYHNISPTWNSNDSGNSEKGNSKNVGGGNYPSLLMTTSTRDDRVHPYHARSFVKRMLECGGEGEGGAGALEEGTVVTSGGAKITSTTTPASASASASATATITVTLDAGEEDVSVSGQLSDKVSFTLGASKGGNATLNVKLPESEAQSPSASKYITDKVFYYENIEGGHGGAADSKQQAFMSVLYLEFLKRVLK